MIQVGKLRIGVVNDICVRLEYAEDEIFCDEPTLFGVLRTYDFKDFKTSDDGKTFTLETKNFKLIYRYMYGMIRPDVLNIELPDGQVWKMGQFDNENLEGTLDSLDGLKKACPLNEGLLSRKGFYMIDDSKSPLVVDGALRSRPKQKFYYDFYFFAYGKDYKGALQTLMQVSGRTPMLPRFVMGSWYSRWYFYTSADYREILKEYKEQGFPLDILVFDR